MLELFQELEKKQKEQGHCVLVLVVSSTGSVPREAGAMMLVDARGLFWGTIGGGLTEFQAIEAARELLQKKETATAQELAVPQGYGRAKRLHFDVSAQNNFMCGGAYDVLLYELDFAQAELCEVFKQINAVARSGAPFQLLLPLEGGLPLLGDKDKSYPSFVEVDGKFYYVQGFQQDGTVYIFGGGHVALELVPVLAHLDFRCVVMDDREDFANRERFPQAAEVFTVDYEQLEKSVALTAKDYVLIMTRGHSCDTEVERFALRSPAKYIGLMGSKNKKALTRAKLMAEGFAAAELERVIIPVGLDIKSETPAEIAISIAAQLIQERAKFSSGLNKYRV